MPDVSDVTITQTEYKGNTLLKFQCAECRPFQMGARKLQIILDHEAEVRAFIAEQQALEAAQSAQEARPGIQAALEALEAEGVTLTDLVALLEKNGKASNKNGNGSPKKKASKKAAKQESQKANPRSEAARKAWATRRAQAEAETRLSSEEEKEQLVSQIRKLGESFSVSSIARIIGVSRGAVAGWIEGKWLPSNERLDDLRSFLTKWEARDPEIISGLEKAGSSRRR